MRLSSDPLSRSPYAESTCSAHPVRPLMSVRPYPVQCEYERAIRWGLCELVEAIALAKFTLGFHVYPYGDRKSQNCSRAYCVGFDSCSARLGNELPALSYRPQYPPLPGFTAVVPNFPFTPSDIKHYSDNSKKTFR